jgi:glycosyltransferase involved in cell wall biosynthesis
MSNAPGALLLVENNGYPMDFRVRREADALHEAGYTVSVICPRGPGQAWKEIINGVHVYRFPAPPGGNGFLGYALEFGYATLAMLLWSLWVSLRRRVDVVHAANPPDTLCIVGAVLKLFGKKFIFDHHDLSPEVYLSRFAVPRENIVHRMLRFFERLSYAVADVVIATNESYRKRAIERGGFAPDKVFVVRNGPPASYRPLPPDPSLAAKAPFLLGYIGTIGPQDGVDYLVRAVHHMVFEIGRKDFIAVIIGDGDAHADVQQLARDLDVERYVMFTGRLAEPEARKLLSTVHVCVQPDPMSPLNDKSTMNKLMEYMALGKPTVAFDLAETRYSAGEAAIYVEPNDEAAFASQIVWLLDHPEVRSTMGQVGQQRVATGLSWEHSVPHLLNAYREGLGLRPSYQPPLGQMQR